MITQLTEILNYLEDRIDPEQVQKNIEKTRRGMVYGGGAEPAIFHDHSTEKFQPLPMKEVHASLEAMLYNELVGVVGTVEAQDDAIPMIRANYGVGSLPSVLGLESYIAENNMPWVKHCEDEDQIQAIIDRGVPDTLGGFVPKIAEAYEFFRETLEKYPNCRDSIKLYHPDYQGPFDNAHLIWGSDIYYAFYDDPDMVKDLLDLVTETYIRAFDQVQALFPNESEEYCYHWGTLYGGKTVVRNDSAVNLSKDMYKEFIRPRDERILLHYGSGSIHHCGRADQILPDLLDTKGLKGLNFGHIPAKKLFGLPFLKEIYSMTRAHNIPLCGYPVTADDEAEFRAGCPDGGYSVRVFRK